MRRINENKKRIRMGIIGKFKSIMYLSLEVTAYQLQGAAF